MAIIHRTFGALGTCLGGVSLALLCFAGCGSKSGGEGSGTVPTVKAPDPLAEKRWILETFKDGYLWTQLLPENVDLAAHATPKDLVEHLVAKAKAQGKDRWSQVKNRTETPARSASDESGEMPYGLEIELKDKKAIIKDVQPGSSAADAGLARGDRILGASHDPSTIVYTGGEDNDRINALKVHARLNAQRDNPTSGTKLWVRVRKKGTDALADAVLVSGKGAPYLVPNASAPRIIPLGPDHKVGFLELKTFKRSAEPLLRQAMETFRNANVTDLIVDLRYNGGGDYETLIVLSNLLRAGSSPREVMFQEKRNAKHADVLRYFQAEPAAIHSRKIAFILTGDSASASEAVVNALLPYYHRNLAIVGERTAGKPVGCSNQSIPNSNLQLTMVETRLLNANGQGDYFKGLPYPHFPGSTVKAEDDLDHAPGDPAEACTAAALRWIQDGSTPHGPIPE